LKTLIFFLTFAFTFSLTDFSYSQKKGQVNLGLGSGLFNFSTLNTGISGTLFNVSGGGSGSSSSTSSSFSFLVGYFPIDKLRIDGGLSIVAFEGSDALMYFNLGGRYFYYSGKKVKLNGGVSANFGITSATERTVSSNSFFSAPERRKPINLSITPFEFQFWPLEGGALTTDFTYTRVFLNGDNQSESSYGINVGLLIRLN